MGERLVEALSVASVVSALVLFWGSRGLPAYLATKEEKKDRKKAQGSIVYVWLITFAIFMILSGFSTL